ncbi:restriction endonuclease [Streptomyces sp. NPDC050161]|uniref:restriction endonuclease n=1 Tax=Streptomyces sp. NPDC050161 TaxID=3365604 RepID=UPI0037B2A5E4
MTPPSPHQSDTPDAGNRALCPEADPWVAYLLDENLRTPPDPGPPGNTPPAEDLNLHIGWERFEKLVLAVLQRSLGLRGIRFRRYGLHGQRQYGIDLAGREPDGRYTVVQCKDYRDFTARDLRLAVEKFTAGRQPFGAYRLIVITSDNTQHKEIAHELSRLQDEHRDLELDVWGSEILNEELRFHADVVARFWTRETADVFCTGAPLPGVPVPPPDLQEQAERILIGPLKTTDMTLSLCEADTQRTEDPARAARIYGELASGLDQAGYRGHATVLRSKQMETLREAGRLDDAASIAAHLAAMALHRGDRFEPRKLARLLETLARETAGSGTARAAATARHTRLIVAAVNDVLHPVGTPTKLRAALDDSAAEEPSYRPLLVLLLAEHLLAVARDELAAIDALLRSAVRQAEKTSPAHAEGEVALRLRLVRAEYDTEERWELAKAARRHRVSGRHAALISAREARRCCLEGRADEALEAWRDAVHDGIRAGLAGEAADWLYAIRGVNVQYGPLTTEIDDEHRLAQALRTTGTRCLLDRVRDPQEQAMSAAVNNKPIEAVLSARRWLIDSVVTGSWADEMEALAFLGDLYRGNEEPAVAAVCYQRAGKPNRIRELAKSVQDSLPVGELKDAPWWVLHARAVTIAEQADLIDDAACGALLGELTGLAIRGRAGELTDSPGYALTLQSAKSACRLAARGTQEQAIAVLDLLSPDVPREPHHYSATDDEHATACVAIACAHPQLAFIALSRLIDLAAYGAEKAISLMTSDRALWLLGAPSRDGYGVGEPTGHDGFSTADQAALRARIGEPSTIDHHLADLLRYEVAPESPSARELAKRARDRILSRPEPTRGRAYIGTGLVTASYLAGSLDEADRRACLEAVLNIAHDIREVVMNRQEALTAAANLVIGLSGEARRTAFSHGKEFTLRKQGMTPLDVLTHNSHPLSAFRSHIGSASLRGHGLRLAVAAASTAAEQEWVRDQAVGLFRSDDTSEVNAAAHSINSLPSEVAAAVDAGLLAAHASVHVRQLSAVLCMRDPNRHGETARRLAGDDDFQVRLTLAEAAARIAADSSALVRELLALLADDPRHSVRQAALRSWTG